MYDSVRTLPHSSTRSTVLIQIFNINNILNEGKGLACDLDPFSDTCGVIGGYFLLTVQMLLVKEYLFS
jgi:hypothetical protein